MSYLEYGGSGHCPDALHHDIEEGLEDGDVSGDKEATGHCGVHVTPTHVTKALEQYKHLNHLHYCLQILLTIWYYFHTDIYVHLRVPRKRKREFSKTR